MKTTRSADIASGCFAVLLGLVVLYAATGITGGMEERLPPRTLPNVLGIAILAAGILLVIRSWRFRGEDILIKWPDRSGAIRVIVILASLAVYIALIDYLGMPICTFLYVSFTVWYLWIGRHALVYAVITGVLSAVVVMYLFIEFLELSFPLGLLQP
ncbi:MAG: tripartite tricarboxylate transporter TctB family protein [Syntrophales bacterium]|nr:tripartite tricarboxylate transporter TctB family protein [Syntrophales bacterium]